MERPQDSAVGFSARLGFWPHLVQLNVFSPVPLGHYSRDHLSHLNAEWLECWMALMCKALQEALLLVWISCHLLGSWVVIIQSNWVINFIIFCCLLNSWMVLTCKTLQWALLLNQISCHFLGIWMVLHKIFWHILRNWVIFLLSNWTIILGTSCRTLGSWMDLMCEVLQWAMLLDWISYHILRNWVVFLQRI